MKRHLFVILLNHNSLISKIPEKMTKAFVKKQDSGLAQRTGFFTELFVF
jgi:hypothetical protein